MTASEANPGWSFLSGEGIDRALWDAVSFNRGGKAGFRKKRKICTSLQDLVGSGYTFEQIIAAAESLGKEVESVLSDISIFDSFASV